VAGRRKRLQARRGRHRQGAQPAGPYVLNGEGHIVEHDMHLSGNEIGQAPVAPDALFVANDGFYSGRRVQLANPASRHALPAAFHSREIVEVGGSYGTNNADAYREYVGRILKGAKPADLPVIQSSKFELVINAEIARMLGFTVPPSLLSVADEAGYTAMSHRQLLGSKAWFPVVISSQGAH
jgi:hypothetical protein